MAIHFRMYPCLENPMDREAWRGYSSWDPKELDTTDCACTHTHTHTHVHIQSRSYTYLMNEYVGKWISKEIQI